MLERYGDDATRSLEIIDVEVNEAIDSTTTASLITAPTVDLRGLIA